MSCTCCGREYEDMNIHHMNYKTGETVLICRTCHGDFHEQFYYDKKKHEFKSRERRIPLEWMKKVLDKYDETNCVGELRK